MAAALAGSLGLLAACGGADGGASAPPPPSATATAIIATPSPTPIPTPTATPLPSGEVVRFLIPSLGIDAPVEQLGIDAQNTLETPKEPAAVGWYTPYGKPNTPANSVWAGYSGMAFNRLSQIEPGAEILLATASGGRIRFQVIDKARYDEKTIDMGAVLSPKSRPPGQAWATLITSDEHDAERGISTSWHVVVAARIP